MHHGRRWRWATMIIHVPPPALPHFRPARRLAGFAEPVDGVQGHRAARAAARSCRAGAHPAPAAAPAGLRPPPSPRGEDPAPAPKPADAPAGHPGDRPALAPPPGYPEVDL